jgi:hypothetical protein
MANVTMRQTIQASADRIWKTIRAFEGIEKFLPPIRHSRMQGSGVGCTRTLTLQDGGTIHERMDRLDDQSRSLTYSIIESALPLVQYTSTMTVRDLGGNRSEVEWAATFEPKGAPEPEVVKLIEGVYAAGFEGLKKLHEG